MHTEEQELYKIILIAAVILAGITGYFIYSIIRQKNHVLKWQQNRIRAEIETLENERRRIASDLHDELGPMLSAIKLQVNHIEPSDAMEKMIIDKSSQHIDEIVKRFREISYDLLPNTLVRKGVLKAAEEFFGKMNDAHPLKIELRIIPLSMQKQTAWKLICTMQVHNWYCILKMTAAGLLILQKWMKAAGWVY